MKTYSPKPGEVEKQWLLVDAKDQTLGRMATQIANALRGKAKPQYAPHIDVGDYVVVINADKIRVTGNKASDKMYRRHSGYTGGLRERTFTEAMEHSAPDVVRKAVWGMVPDTRMGRAQMRKLKIYTGDEHPHDAHNPQPLDLGN